MSDCGHSRRVAPLVSSLPIIALLGMLPMARAVSAAPPPAASPAAALKACAAIDDAGERLICYDRAAGRRNSAAPKMHQPANTAHALSKTFGLYAAEHPAPPKATSLTARVTALGGGAAGSRITLAGGQLWAVLEDPDPLLKVGDTVTIHRASLGSFLMRTPSGRTVRVQRIR